MASGSWNDFRKERQRKRLTNEKEKLRRRMRKTEGTEKEEQRGRLQEAEEGEKEEITPGVKAEKKEREADDMFDEASEPDETEKKFQEALNEDSAFLEALQAVARVETDEEDEEGINAGVPDADDEESNKEKADDEKEETSVKETKESVSADDAALEKKASGKAKTPEGTNLSGKTTDSQRVSIPPQPRRAQSASTGTKTKETSGTGSAKSARQAGSGHPGAGTEQTRQSGRRPTAQTTRTRNQAAKSSSVPVKKEVRAKAKPQKVKRERKPIPPAVLKRRIRFAMSFLLGVLLCCVIAGCGYFYLARRTYHGYRVLRSSVQEDIVSTQYANFDGRILRYSTNNISLVDDTLDSLWIEACDMSNPIADIAGKHAVVADRDGTSLIMVSENGVTGRTKTPYPIVKVCVSKEGLAAAILNGNNEMWINFYGPDGSLIADNQTTLEDPGFPLDVALADNGHVMMVTYQYIDGGDTTSYVAFYNFGDVGQNADDRIVSGYTYKGIVIPEIEWLSGGQSVAFRDNGLATYTGTQIPKQEREVEVTEEIVSTFYDEDTIGLVFKSNGQNKMYTMQVYNASGRLKFSKDFNIAYTTIKMSDDYILMYNSAQLCIFTEDGVQRYMGTVDGSINNVVKLGFNKYLLVLDTGVNIVRFR